MEDDTSSERERVTVVVCMVSRIMPDNGELERGVVLEESGVESLTKQRVDVAGIVKVWAEVHHGQIIHV